MPETHLPIGTRNGQILVSYALDTEVPQEMALSAEVYAGVPLRSGPLGTLCDVDLPWMGKNSPALRNITCLFSVPYSL